MAFNILTTVIGIVFGLGLMILVHEWGHFIVAKAFGVRVDVFSIGFGPRLFGVKRGATDYRFSALPLGGYVRMAGDNSFEERKKEPDEVLSKPRWQRVLISLAGPAMNVLTALVIFTAVYMLGTEEYVFLSQPIQIAGVFKDSPAATAGFQPGDRIVELDGVKDPTWYRLRLDLLFSIPGNTLNATVDRNGTLVPAKIVTGADEISAVGFPVKPWVAIQNVAPGTPAERAGLKVGDHILGLNGVELVNPADLSARIQRTGSAPVQLLIERGGQQQSVKVSPELNASPNGGQTWQIGVGIGPEFPKAMRRYSLFPAIGHSIEVTTFMAKQIVIVVGDLFRRKVLLKQLEGPLGIARDSGEAARTGPISLLLLMATISINLAVLNLLPIGPLDGGHIILLVIEGGIRRDLSLRFKERFVTVSVVFLLLVFAVVMYNDVLRLFAHL
ncbi:MAG TPA: RIP metalloprotease RseP [Methylomirabilota bacterium]|nr:RIP metalloprotease RseP [Methylomirabilota bacterium]